MLYRPKEMLLQRMKKTIESQIMSKNGGEVFVEQHDMEEFYPWIINIGMVQKKRGCISVKRL